MSPRGDLSKLKDAAREQLESDGLKRVEEGLRPWDVRLAAKAKRGTRILVVLTGLVTAAGTMVGTVVRLWRSWRAGPEVAPAELPKTGQPTIATDRVPEPPKHKP